MHGTFPCFASAKRQNGTTRLKSKNLLKYWFSISNRVRKNWCLALISTRDENNMYFTSFLPWKKNVITLYKVAYIIKPGWQLIAVARSNHTELSPERTFTRVFKTGVKFHLGQNVWQIYKGFFIDGGNFTCNVALKRKLYDAKLQLQRQ